MVNWDKESDWLPLSNAVAQVVFWKDDLRKAQAFVHLLQGMHVSPEHKMYRVAIADVSTSERGLRDAQQKLKETYERVVGTTL